MPTNEELQDQIVELQSRLVYQEDLLHSLNEVIAQQDGIITQLQQQFKQHRQKMDDMVATMDVPNSEKPPHY